jgi:putative transposase
MLSIDNGPEFISKALDAWAHRHGVQLESSRPGKPTDNAFIEAFNRRFRDECLNQHWFESLEEARTAIEAWRVDYNTERPHCALGQQTPAAFGAARAPPEKEAGANPTVGPENGLFVGLRDPGRRALMRRGGSGVSGCRGRSGRNPGV